MIQQKFVVSRRNQSQKIDNWYETCKKEKIPYVVIEARNKYADVRFDHESLPKKYDEYLTDNTEQITDKAIQIFRKYKVKGSKFSIIPFIVNIYNIPIDKAEIAASELFDLIKSCIPT